MDEEILKQAGVNYQEGLKRFSGHRELYEKYVVGFEDEDGFRQLERAMEDRDYEKAFKIAHTLKGLIGNLSFTGLYDEVFPFVEDLRGGRDIAHAVETFPKLMAVYRRTMEAINQARKL